MLIKPSNIEIIAKNFQVICCMIIQMDVVEEKRLPAKV